MKQHLLFCLLILISITVSAQHVILDHTSYILLEPTDIKYADSSLADLYGLRLGQNSQPFNNSLTSNTAVGFESMYRLDSSGNSGSGGSGERNTALGSRSFRNIEFSRLSTAIGHNSLTMASQSDYHTAIGSHSSQFLDYNVYGNTAIGSYSLLYARSGSYNTAVGISAMSGIGLTSPSGVNNVALGAFANNGYNANSNGIYIGCYTGFRHFYLNDHISIGAFAAFNTAESSNISIGTQANFALTNSGNIAIGHMAFKSISNGTFNIALGANIMKNSTSYLANALLIGSGTYASSSADLIIESNPSGLNDLIYGNFSERKVFIDADANDLANNTVAFWVSGEASKNTAGDWVSHSDARLKTNIQTLNAQNELSKIANLNGVNYQWKNQKIDTKTYTGFIAQNIQEYYPSKVKADHKGYLTTSYGSLKPYLVEAIKALNLNINSLEEQTFMLSQIDKNLDLILNNFENEN